MLASSTQTYKASSDVESSTLVSTSFLDSSKPELPSQSSRSLFYLSIAALSDLIFFMVNVRMRVFDVKVYSFTEGTERLSL